MNTTIPTQVFRTALFEANADLANEMVDFQDHLVSPTVASGGNDNYNIANGDVTVSLHGDAGLVEELLQVIKNHANSVFKSTKSSSIRANTLQMSVSSSLSSPVH